MLTADQISEWEPVTTYHVGADGLVVYQAGKPVLTIPPDAFPDVILRMAGVLTAKT